MILTFRALLCVLSILFLFTQLAVSDPFHLAARQDASETAASTAPSSSDAATASDAQSSSASATASSQTLEDPSSSVLSSAPSTMMTSTSSQASLTSSTASAVAPSVTNGTAVDHKLNEGVFIAVTPALGVAGVILMLTGLAYTFIGVRQRETQVFFSIAYLISLGILVLLLYLINPPVSNAIQGAYLVAVVVPAGAIAGLSLIFKDLVEGLGCLLGGFSLAMWLMTLRDNGLIEGQGGRVGFICGMTAAALALWFSQYTRQYGLIACIAVGGATAIILGIDCFSKAGLKEFWVYIWQLNNQLLIFPQDFNNFQVTRGIKVESAGVIILAILGIMSQMKLWRVVQARRKTQEEKKRQAQEDREQNDQLRADEFGEANKRDLEEWEKAYGTKNCPDASVSNLTGSSGLHSRPSSMKGSLVNVREIGGQHEAMEMADLGESSRRGSHVGSDSRRSSKDPASVRTTSVEIDDNGLAKNEKAMRALDSVSERPSRTPSTKNYVVKGHDDDGHWEVTEKAPSPEVTPLPFKVPEQEDTQSKRDDDVGSVATLGESLPFGVDKPNPAHRLSQARNGKRLSAGTGRGSVRFEDEEPVFAVPHVEDDRSSVAATIDGITDAEALSLPETSRGGTSLSSPGQDKENPVETYTLSRRNSAVSVEEPTKETAEDYLGPFVDQQSLAPATDKPEWPLGSVTKLNPAEKGMEGPPSPTGSMKRPSKEIERNERSNSKKIKALTKDALPEGQSKTVHLFRTNEWAKHQAVAETPDIDAIAPPSEPGVAVAYGSEAAAPVNVEALQQDAFTPQPAAVSRSASHTSNNPYRQSSVSKDKSSQNLSSTSVRYDSSMQLSAANLARNASTTSINQRQTPHRSSSNPRASVTRSPSNPLLPSSQHASRTNLLNQPLMETPGEDHLNAAPPNLMDRRRDLLQGRQSTMSFANPDVLGPLANSSNPNLLNGASPHRPHPSPTPSDDNLSLSSRKRQVSSPVQPSAKKDDDDDMTLAQRRNLIRSQSQLHSNNPYNTSQSAKVQANTGLARAHSAQYQPHPHGSTVAFGPAPTQPYIYDSHQPSRSSARPADMENRFAQWRGSFTPEPGMRLQRSSSNLNVAAGGGVERGIEAGRARMMEEARERGARREREVEGKRAREGMMDERMRRGDLVDLHREKMREMQRQVSRREGKGA